MSCDHNHQTSFDQVMNVVNGMAKFFAIGVAIWIGFWMILAMFTPEADSSDPYQKTGAYRCVQGDPRSFAEGSIGRTFPSC